MAKKSKATWLKSIPSQPPIPEECWTLRNNINSNIRYVSTTLNEPLRDTYNRMYDEFQKVTGLNLKGLQLHAKQNGQSYKKIEVIQYAGKLEVLEDISSRFHDDAVKEAEKLKEQPF